MSLITVAEEFFGEGVSHVLCKAADTLSEKRQNAAEEIRLRVNSPLAVKIDGSLLFVSRDKTRALTDDSKNAVIVSERDISEALSLICGYSAYAFSDEIKNGFITVKGGHRVGICGKTVVENGEIKTIKNVSSLCVRLQRQFLGCADTVMPLILRNGEIRSTIIVSPPGKGKTTLLRDIIRQLSNGVPRLGFYGANVSVIDERGELAAVSFGVPANDLGARTDVLDGCPKDKGMKIVLRSMSPAVVAADEIGGAGDASAIEEMLRSGVKVICTAHGGSVSDIAEKRGLSELVSKRLFGLYIVVSGGKPLETISAYDGELLEIRECVEERIKPKNQKEGGALC